MMGEIKHRSLLLAVGVAITLSIVAALAATPYGIGVTPDSVVYLRAAQSLHDGQGLYIPAYDGALVPLTHFPPLYPATLAGLAALGLEPIRAAQWAALLIAAGNILAIACASFLFTGSRAVSAAVCVVMALSVDILFLNTAVWSDAEFIFLAVVSLLCLSPYFQGRGSRYLLASASAAALAWLTRWVGGALIMTGVVGVVTFGPGTYRRRCFDGALFGALASAPGVAWMVRNLNAGGSLTDRTLQPLGDPAGDIAAAFETMCSWLLPGTNRIQVIAGQAWLVSACAVLFAAGLLYALVRYAIPSINSRIDFARTPVVFGLFVVVYTCSVLLAAAYFDSVPMDNRVLAPVYVSAVLVAAWIAHAAHRHTTTPYVRFAIKVVVTGLVLLNAAVTAGAVVHFRAEGRGFVGPQWEYTLVRESLANAPEDDIVFSNYDTAVDFRFGRRAAPLTPEGLSLAVARGGEAILVYFETPRSYAPRSPGAVKDLPATVEYLDQLLGAYTADLIVRERNARVYRLRPLRGRLSSAD